MEKAALPRWEEEEAEGAEGGNSIISVAAPGPEKNHGAPNLDLTQAIAEKVVKGQLGGPIQKED